MKPRKPQAPRIDWRRVDGILLLDKPQGLSSNQALQAARRLFRAEKGGHTGALDPLATGLLPPCFGEATKVAGRLLGGVKRYRTVARLGARTDTGDAEGRVLATAPVSPLDAATLEAALVPLRGTIRQRPPVYSALKQGGEPLYAKARRGEVVDVPERTVEIHALTLLGFTADTIELDVTCSAGTYIRSLVEDLGAALGCGAHVAVLRRTAAEPFDDRQLWTLEQLTELSERGVEALDASLLDIAAALPALPRRSLSPDEIERLRCGQGVPRGALPEGEALLLDGAGRAFALATVQGERAQPSRLLQTAGAQGGAA